MSKGGIDDETMIDIDKEKILEYLNEILDKPVLLAWPLGVKGAPRKWGEITYETIKWKEIKQAAARGGNIGIVLGPLSGNLITIDLDTDEERDKFFEWGPWAKDTLISIGAKGCQCWFYIDGVYPSKRMVWKTIDGKPTIEFRGGDGIQSIIWGKHPDIKGRYRINGKKPKRISYLELQQYYAWLQEKGDECDEEWREGQKGDFTWTKDYKGCDLKELDLPGLLTEAGIRHQQIDSEEQAERYALICPWIDEHTTENAKRDAVVFMFPPRGKYWPAFRCFHSHCHERHLRDLLDWLKSERDILPGTVRKYCSNHDRGRIEIEDDDVIERPLTPNPIIDGLLYPELKMLIASAAKIGKTWIGIDLALSLATGTTWLDFDTCQSRVLFLNLEMPALFFRQRIFDVKKVKRITEFKGLFKRAHLRGEDKLEGNLNALYKTCEEHGPFDVIIYDPIYKLLGDLDENKASDVAKLLRMIDQVGKVTKAASVLFHHYAKGDPWVKKAGDRASGSGVFLRDPDTYMAVTEMGEENSGQARVDFRLRCSPPISPFGIRWGVDYWKRDPSIDISKSRKNKDSESKASKPTVADRMLQILKDNPTGLTYTQWKNAVRVESITTEGNFENVVRDLTRVKRIKQIDKLYYVI